MSVSAGLLETLNAKDDNSRDLFNNKSMSIDIRLNDYFLYATLKIYLQDYLRDVKKCEGCTNNSLTVKPISIGIFDLNAIFLGRHFQNMARLLEIKGKEK